MGKTHTCVPGDQSKLGAYTVLIPMDKNRKNDLILIMTPEKQDKTLELSKCLILILTKLLPFSLIRNFRPFSLTLPFPLRLKKI